LGIFTGHGAEERVDAQFRGGSSLLVKVS